MTSLAPQVVDVEGLLATFLPKQLTTSFGDVVSLGANGNLAWVDENADTKLKGGTVYGTFKRLTAQTRRVDTNHAQGSTTASQVDTIRFHAGTLTYLVTQRDIVAIQSIVGKLGGVTHTFVPVTDYVPFATAGYTTLSAVQWTAGGSKPDDDTDTTVTYTHYKATRLAMQWQLMTWRLGLQCIDLTMGGRTYDRSRLCDQLMQDLERHLLSNRGKQLAVGLNVGGFMPLGGPTISTGESRARLFLDLYLRRNQEVVADIVERVGSIPLPPPTFLP